MLILFRNPGVEGLTSYVCEAQSISVNVEHVEGGEPNYFQASFRVFKNGSWYMEYNYQIHSIFSMSVFQDNIIRFIAMYMDNGDNERNPLDVAKVVIEASATGWAEDEKGIHPVDSNFSVQQTAPEVTKEVEETVNE